jgi:hypothetical protein
MRSSLLPHAALLERIFWSEQLLAKFRLVQINLLAFRHYQTVINFLSYYTLVAKLEALLLQKAKLVKNVFKSTGVSN